MNTHFRCQNSRKQTLLYKNSKLWVIDIKMFVGKKTYKYSTVLDRL